jgi:hypothetical protein
MGIALGKHSVFAAVSDRRREVANYWGGLHGR